MCTSVASCTGFNYATQLEKGCELVSRNEPNFLENMKTSALEYTPPEILCQEEYLGKPADVWSMGVVFYMMVAGEKPFIAPPHEFPLVRVDLYAKEICERQPIYDNFMVSKEAKRLARKLLQLDPAKRPTLRQLRGSLSNWVYLALGPNQVENIARAHKRKYEKLENIARAHKRKYQQQGRAEKGETVAGDQGETDPEPLFIHRTYDFMEETPAPLRSTPELVHRRYSDKCEALIINRTKPRDAEDNVNTRKVDDDASHADSDRSGNVDADFSDLSTRKRRGRDASHADRSGNVDADLSARKRRGRDASHAESDRSGNVDADLNARKRRGRDASHADRSGNVDADLSARKRRGRDASHAESDRSGNVDADLSAGKRRGRDASHADSDRPGNVDADLSVRKRRGRDASHADRSGNVDTDLSARKRRGRDASHAESDRSGNVDADLSARKRRGRDASHADRSGNVDTDLSARKRRGRDASHADRSGNVDADLSARKRRGRDASHADSDWSGNVDADLSTRKHRGRRLVFMTQKGVENLMERNTFAPKPPSERKCAVADEVVPPSGHHPSSQMTQKDVGDLVAGFVPKPPPGKKYAGVAAPQSGQHPSSQMTRTQKDVGDLGAGFVPKPPPGKKSASVAAPKPSQRPSSRAHIRKRERMESVSKREKEEELTAAKTLRFRARVPSPSLTPPPECLTQVDPEEGVLKLADGGPSLKRSTISVQKVPANTTSRFRARIFSPSLTPPPECLTQAEPEEDGELTYLGGGGLSMKLSPDGGKLVPMTQKDVGKLGTDLVPKPPPGKKSAGVAAPQSGQPQSSRAQIRKRERRVPQESVSKREKGGELPANKTSRFRAPIPSPGLTPPPECLDQVEPDEDCEPSYLEGSGLSVKLLSDGRKRIPMTKKDVGGTCPVPKPPPGKKSAGVAAPQPGQPQSSRAQIRNSERERRVPQQSVSKREKGGELPANKTSRFRAPIPSPCLTPPPECLTQEEPEEGALNLKVGGLSPKRSTKSVQNVPANKTSRFRARIPSPCLTPPPECLTQVEPEDSELMYQGGCGSTMKLSPGTAGMVRPPYAQRTSSRAQIRKKERMESGSKREEDGKLTANKTFRFQARVPSPDLTPPPECLDLEPNEDERKTAPMTQKSIDSLTDATTFAPKPPPRKKSTAAGMVARPSGQHQSSRAPRAQITLKHRRVISPNGPTENVKSFKDDSQVAHSTTFRWHAERLSPCPSPPPECLVQEEPADGVLGDSEPSLKRSTPMRSQRHPDVGPREEERGDGEDGSVRRSNIRGTKSRSDGDMKRTSRKSEGDVRSTMKRTEANVGQRVDDSSTRKRGKSRSQRHNKDGAEADADGGHALRKTSGRVLLPPVDAKQKKRLDGRARLPPINRRS
ncbi:uncharacterized protein LOC144871667 isoform X2 [Branchiostoma floridae x Branchiostoma japonicum]